MKRKTRPFWGLALAVTLAIGLAPDVFAADSAPVKLTIAVQRTPNIEDHTTNLFTKYLEKSANVKLEFVYLPVKLDDAKAKLAIMIASNATLPDIICMGLDDNSVSSYTSSGVFQKLNDFYKDPSLTANFRKMPDFAQRNVLRYTKMPDGNIYSMPSYVINSWNEGPYRSWINTEWLKKLGLKAPTTTTELTAVLKAFVEKDPNGNGKKDEAGIAGSTNGWGNNPFVFLMNPFIYANPDNAYFAVNDGKVVPSFTQPEWKQGLEYMNKLMKDGLIDPASFTQDRTQLKGQVNVKGGRVGIVPSGSYSVFDPTILEPGLMTLLAPLKGPTGKANSPQNPSLPSNVWFITKYCKNPKAAFKLGDVMLSKEASDFNRFGEYGAEWTDDPKVVAQYAYSPEVDPKARKLVVLNAKWWSNPQNKSWQQVGPIFHDQGFLAISTVRIDDTTTKLATNWTELYNKNYKPAFPDEPIGKLFYSNDDSDKIVDIKATIDKYVVDTSLEFVFGAKPLSQWNNYLAELQKMGLEKYLAVQQAAYDRSK